MHANVDVGRKWFFNLSGVNGDEIGGGLVLVGFFQINSWNPLSNFIEKMAICKLGSNYSFWVDTKKREKIKKEKVIWVRGPDKHISVALFIEQQHG